MLKILKLGIVALLLTTNFCANAQTTIVTEIKQTELKPSATNALLDVTVTDFKNKPLIGDKKKLGTFIQNGKRIKCR